MAQSAPLAGAGGAGIEPAHGHPDIEHALAGAGRAVHRLYQSESRPGPVPWRLNEQVIPLHSAPHRASADERDDELLEPAAWPWMAAYSFRVPLEPLLVQHYRFLMARLGGSVGELSLAILMVQRTLVAERTWGQARCLRMLVITCAILARKIVHEVEVSTTECCEALADLFPHLDSDRVGRMEWAIMRRIDWRIGTKDECQVFADALFDCANENADVQRAAPRL